MAQCRRGCGETVQWVGAMCQRCWVMVVYMAQMIGETVDVVTSTSVGTRTKRLVVKAGATVSHRIFHANDGQWDMLHQSWFNDGQGIEWTWKKNSRDGIPVHGGYYFSYEMLDALRMPFGDHLVMYCSNREEVVA